MSHYDRDYKPNRIIRGPLPDLGPGAGTTQHDGSVPGDGFSTGLWTIVNGQQVHKDIPSGFSFPPGDAHPMPPTPHST